MSKKFRKLIYCYIIQIMKLRFTFSLKKNALTCKFTALRITIFETLDCSSSFIIQGIQKLHAS